MGGDSRAWAESCCLCCFRRSLPGIEDGWRGCSWSIFEIHMHIDSFRSAKIFLAAMASPRCAANVKSTAWGQVAVNFLAAAR